MDENRMAGEAGELSFTISVKRKETGKVETYQLIGKLNQEQLDTLQENGNGSNTFNSGS